jgi:hypothetical protein
MKSTFPTISRGRDNKRGELSTRLNATTNIAMSIFRLRFTIPRSMDGHNLSKLCPVFRVNERPPIVEFIDEKS